MSNDSYSDDLDRTRPEGLTGILDALSTAISMARAMPMSSSVLVNRAEMLDLVDQALAVGEAARLLVVAALELGDVLDRLVVLRDELAHLVLVGVGGELQLGDVDGGAEHAGRALHQGERRLGRRRDPRLTQFSQIQLLYWATKSP